MVRSFASFVFFASLAAVTAAASGPTPALGSFGYEAQTASQVSVDVPLGQQKHEAILRRRSRGARVLLATSALAATLAMAFLIMHCFMLLKNSQHRGSRLRRLSSDDEGACEQVEVEELEEEEELFEDAQEAQEAQEGGAEGGVTEEEARKAREGAMDAFRDYISATERAHQETIRLAQRLTDMIPTFPSLTSLLGRAIGFFSAMDQAATQGVVIMPAAEPAAPRESLTDIISRAAYAGTARTAAALAAATALASAARLTQECGIVPEDEDEQAEALLRRAAAVGSEGALLLRGIRHSDPDFLPPGGAPRANDAVDELSRARDAIGGVAGDEVGIALLALSAASGEQEGPEERRCFQDAARLSESSLNPDDRSPAADATRALLRTYLAPEFLGQQQEQEQEQEQEPGSQVRRL